MAIASQAIASQAIASRASASNPKPISDCSDASGLQAAVAAGGSYVFQCTSNFNAIQLTQPLVANKSVSIDGGAHGPEILNEGGRVFDIEGGNITLTDLTLVGHLVFKGSAGQAGTPGQTGSAGTNGGTGPGTNGGPGGNGSAGGVGGSAASAQGGSVFLAGRSTLTLVKDTVEGEASSEGGNGGAGGAGGNGGERGSGLCGPSGCHAYAGGNAGNGAGGGSGGPVAPAEGGGIYVSAGASLTAQNTDFVGGLVTSTGGFGGAGGNGGTGGSGYGGCVLSTDVGDGTNGNAAAGGSARTGGVVEGGAIYNDGTLTLENDSFSQDGATSLGGSGGNGGAGGGNENDSPGNGGCQYGTNGNGANGGDGGTAEGGAVYSTTRPTICQASFSNDSVSSTGGSGGTVYSSPPGVPNATPGAAGSRGVASTPDYYGPTVPGGTAAACESDLSGTLTFTDPAGVPAADVEVQADGPNGPVTLVTNSRGQYSRMLPDGEYTVDPESDLSPTADPSADCTVSGSACKIDLTTNRVANFSVKCETTIDFHTSMIADGCFIPADPQGKTRKAIGPFRMDGINFESPDDQSSPVIFNDQKKSVTGDRVRMWLDAPKWDGKFLAFYVPGGLDLSFPFSEQRTTWALSTPWGTPGGVVGKGLGFLSTPLGGTQTLFGFPAHSPAVELTFTPGQTTLQMQISFPPTTGAYLDPINGQWKKPNNGRTDYPLAFRVKATATNKAGVSQIEGSVAFANVYGVDTQNDRFVNGEGGAPPVGTVELARLGFTWQLGEGILHAQATLVIHKSPSAEAAEYVEKYLQPLSAFLGKVVVNVDAAFKWLTAVNVAGRSVPLPGLVGLSVQINNINKYIPDTPGLFWQRLGINGGIDVTNPLGRYSLGGNVGFTWLPRFKSDRLWFQELASLDGNVQFTFDPLSFAGTGDFKVAGVTLIHGGIKVDNQTGLSVEGDVGLDLNQFLRVRFPAKITGEGRLTLPPTGPSNWQLTAEGKVDIWTIAGSGKFAMNAGSAGLCVSSRRLGMQGIYFDGAWHIGGCDAGPFGTAGSVGASSNVPTGTPGPNDKSADVATVRAPSFKLTHRSHVSSVAVLGVSRPPRFTLHGPDGLTLTTPTTKPAVLSRHVSLILNSSDHTTYIMLRGAKPGHYILTLQRGSPGVIGLQFSAPLPPPSVHASLAARGCTEALSWRLRPLRGQTVLFEEQSADGITPLGTTDAARGTITYTPSAGSGARQIIAVIEQQGTPRARRVVAHYQPPTGTGKVSGLHEQPSGSRVGLSWARVCGATFYLVSVGSGSSAVTTTTSRTSATADIGERRHVPITVQAVNDADQIGKPARLVAN